MWRGLKLPVIVFLICLALAALGTVLLVTSPKNSAVGRIVTEIPPATPFDPFPYRAPAIPQKRSYLTVLIGDSMTEALGVNANQLRLDLIKLYPNNEFVNYNYGFGSTNILSLPARLSSGGTYLGKTYPPILTQGFDLIIIESFAYNPLSELGLEEGLQKHAEVLDASIKQLIKSHPESVIALMTPIAPNRATFAVGTVNLTPAQRQQWVTERLAYIQKHIDYAKEKNIPLINVYEKSLMKNGDGNPKYINQNDHIHPSKAGIELISQTIANFIFQNKIFPVSL